MKTFKGCHKCGNFKDKPEACMTCLHDWADGDTEQNCDNNFVKKKIKTFKAFDLVIKGVKFTFIFTLHHIAFGIYWAAPKLMGKRIYSISLHLPFFIFSVGWVR